MMDVNKCLFLFLVITPLHTQKDLPKVLFIYVFS